ncbi:MAG: DNA adenine methylase [Candidatus Lokiarchaeota archaeon]|nr:DNA adenine methylase [Candidatus Lokiarchaeota archaeon]
MTSFLDGFTFTTRYRGSKVKIVPAIYDVVKNLNFTTVLDAFAGTGVVSYLFKRLDKQVLFNDHLKFNYTVGRALIENSEVRLTKADVNRILHQKSYNQHPHLIEEQFADIYYTHDENIWLDRVISNLYELEPGYTRDLGFWCLFQSCITKRPFSLFHRKNLYLRTRNVNRSFGNKVTWDTPFEVHFKKFAEEVNSYIIKTNHGCSALSLDVMQVPLDYYENGFDLVYIDPPYIPKRGENIIYRDLYHFLEGIMQYDSWIDQIDTKSKHKRIKPIYNVWNDKRNIYNAFKMLLKRYKESNILLSHRSDGIPSTTELIDLLKERWSAVSIVNSIDHKYALSTRSSNEILILAHN